MKNIKFDYSETKQLQNLIEEVYFNENNGKLCETNKKVLILKEDNFYHKLLTGLEGYQVKIRSVEIIDGSLSFDLKEEENLVTLIPTSKYCIKKGGKYSFY